MDQGNPEAACRLIDKVTSDLRNAKPIWLFLTLIMYMISNISRAVRWKMLAEAEHGSVRISNTFLACMVGYFTNLAIPRLGEFVRAGTLSKYEKINAASAMGTVVTDRLLDVLTLGIIFGVGMLSSSGRITDYLADNAVLPRFSWLTLIGLAAAGMAILGFIIFYFRNHPDHPLVVKVSDKIKEFLQGVLSFKKVKKRGWLIFHSINIWFMYYLMTYLPFFSFEATAGLGPAAALLVFIFGGLGMVLPAPGGIGTFHAMVIAGLSIYGISGPDAFSFAMIIFLLFNLCVNIFMGVLSFILLPVVNKNYHPVRPL